jgi:hypothetical protein
MHWSTRSATNASLRLLTSPLALMGPSISINKSAELRDTRSACSTSSRLCR